MATGPEHYLAAERALKVAHDVEVGGDDAPFNLLAAQVHATLALAAATGLQVSPIDSEPDFEAWDRVAGVRSPCAGCSGPNRKTTGMVCQACGRDYSAGAG